MSAKWIDATRPPGLRRRAGWFSGERSARPAAGLARPAGLACRAALCGLLAFVLCSGSAGAQGSDCLRLARSIYRKMNAPLDGRAYRMRYTVHARMRPDLKQEDVVTHVELKMSDSAVHFITKEVEVFQDEHQAFTVIPARGVIYLSDADLPGMRQKRMKMLSMLQDTLFSMCESAECRDLRSGGRTLREVTMKLNGRAQSLYHARTLTLLVDAKEEMIRGMTLHYTGDSKIETLEMTVEAFDFIAGADELTGPVASNIFTSDHRLLPRYRRYRVIDNRSKRFTK